MSLEDFAMANDATATTDYTKLSERLTIGAVMLERTGKHVQHVAHLVRRSSTGLILLSGPMRSAKTEIVLLVLRSLRDMPVLVAKPRLDTRNKGLWSRGAGAHSAVLIRDETHLKRVIWKRKPQIIVFDEAQFATPETIEHLLALSREMLVIVSTLDRDFRGDFWQNYITLISSDAACTLRDEGRLGHLKLTGVCQFCGAEATHSKLLKTPPTSRDNIVIGDDAYATVCASCHQKP